MRHNPRPCHPEQFATEKRFIDATNVAADAAPQLARQLPEATATALTEQAEQRHDWLVEGGRPNRTVVSGAYQHTDDSRVSTTDPDLLARAKAEFAQATEAYNRATSAR